MEDKKYCYDCRCIDIEATYVKCMYKEIPIDEWDEGCRHWNKIGCGQCYSYEKGKCKIKKVEKAEDDICFAFFKKKML